MSSANSYCKVFNYKLTSSRSSTAPLAENDATEFWEVKLLSSEVVEPLMLLKNSDVLLRRLIGLSLEIAIEMDRDAEIGVLDPDFLEGISGGGVELFKH